MPHSTYSYGFESRVWEGISTLCEHFNNQRRKTLIVILDQENEVRKIVFDVTGSARTKEIRNLHDNTMKWLFYDPFDSPEYIWLAWRNISRDVMEHLLGVSFQAKDFLPNRDGAEIIHSFPETWEVMF